MTDALAEIDALEAELADAQRKLAQLEAEAPTECTNPAHAAAPARTAKLEAALARVRPGAGTRRFLVRLEKDRPKRLQVEYERLEERIASARAGAVGDRALLAVLKRLRSERNVLLAELAALRATERG